MLTEGDINRGNYAGYTRGGAGVVVLKSGDGLYSTSADRNDVVSNVPEFIVDNGELVTVNNANVSTQEAASLLEVDADSLDNTLRNMVDEGALSGAQSPDVHAHFRFEAFAEYINKNFSDVYNPDGMLYDATKRADFYDRFISVLSSKGVTTGITKEEFTSKTGVLVITPVIGFDNGGYLSFPTANEIVEKGLSSVFKTIYDVTGNHYSDRQVPYGDSNGTVGVTELAQYYTMHDINNQPIDNKSGGLADILARKHQGTNYRYGFGVLGLSWQGNTKAATSKGICDRQLEEARDSKDMFDIEAIERKLNTYVDFTGRKVSDELIDMFVERIIYRDNDEFVWEMNLTGVRKNTIDYRIKEYSEEYAQALQNDDNFNIIHTFIISVEECQQFMKSPKVNRRFVKKFWRPITVKIAIK